MMKGGTLLILVYGVNGLGQNWHHAYVYMTLEHETHYSLNPVTFKLQMSVVHDERRNSIDFGSEVKVKLSIVYKTFWTLYRLQYYYNHF